MTAAADSTTKRTALRGTAPIVPPLLEHRHHVWHYTDAGGLAGIISGSPSGHQEQTGVLWATAATMLNDPDELTYGAERVAKWFEREGNARAGGAAVHVAIRSVLSDLRDWILTNPAYVVCASADGDMLGQWRGYAGKAGFAIELDPADEYAIWGRPNPNSSFAWAPAWIKVAYTPSDQDTLMQHYFSYMLDDRQKLGHLIESGGGNVATELVRALLSGLASALKHPTFAAEQEVRLIAFPPREVRPMFRGGDRGLMPYLEVVPAIFPNAMEPLRPMQLPVKSIRVGPPRGDLMTQRERAARILLDATGRSRAPLNRSVIPFIP